MRAYTGRVIRVIIGMVLAIMFNAPFGDDANEANFKVRALEEALQIFVRSLMDIVYMRHKAVPQAFSLSSAKGSRRTPYLLSWGRRRSRRPGARLLKPASGRFSPNRAAYVRPRLLQAFSLKPFACGFA